MGRKTTKKTADIAENKESKVHFEKSWAPARAWWSQTRDPERNVIGKGWSSDAFFKKWFKDRNLLLLYKG